MTTAQNYTVTLPHFEGPLELLINLIERRELEVTELSISQVTGDYLATVSALEKVHSEDLRQFLDIGSKLVLFKTRAIRREHQETDSDNESLAELTVQLERYRLWRQASKTIEASFGIALATRPDSSTTDQPPKNLSISHMISCWRGILTQKPKAPLSTHNITISRADIDKTMRRLLQNITKKQQFSQTITSPDRRGKTIRFLAILELIRQDLVELIVEQEEIYVQAT